MSTLGTASGIGRAMVCPASQVLPHADRQTVHTEGGNCMHEFLANVGTMGREPALELVPEEFRERCAAIDIEALPHLDPASTAAEVAFVYDLETDTAREVGRNIGRAYPTLEAREIAGTADAVGLSADGWDVVVIDYKSPHHHVPRAQENWQLRTLALMAARAYGVNSATVALVKIRDDGSVWYDQATFDAMDLDSFADQLCEQRKTVGALREAHAKGSQLDVRMGPHCRYCPAFAACPGQTSLVRQMASADDFTQDMRALLTPQTAARAYERVRQAKTALKMIEQALEDFARDQPFALSDGAIYGPVESSREEIDGARARDVLSMLHGPDVADRACEYEASKKSVERAIRLVYEKRKQAGEKVTLKDLMGEALDALRRSGGVLKKTSIVVREYRDS